MQVILGIDPGFVCAGYSIIEKNGKACRLIDFGAFKMASSKSLSARVGLFFNFFSSKVLQFQVTHIALETPFLGKNAQNFLKLGYLRGLLYLIADNHNLALLEFAPTQIKLSVTGYGGASKEQVSRVIHKFFPALPVCEKLDITDAIAVAITAVWSFSKEF